MHDPYQNKFVSVPADESTLTREQRSWTRFQEGEQVDLKGTSFVISEIGESRMILKPIKK